MTRVAKDQKVRALIAAYEQAGLQIASLLMTMLDTYDPGLRVALLRRVTALMDAVHAQAETWAGREIPRLYGEEALAQSRPHLSVMLSDLAKARRSVELFAARLARQTSLEAEFPELAAISQSVLGGEAAPRTVAEHIARLLRFRVREDIVSVIGKDGRAYSFGLGSYAGTVIQSAAMQAQNSGFLDRARGGGQDLVQVSENPSMHGDWCDAYRGRVYSISGTHPVFPALWRLPNGGPPFHPWCRHDLLVWRPEGRSRFEIARVSNTDQRFLLRPGESVNRVAKLWRVGA